MAKSGRVMLLHALKTGTGYLTAAVVVGFACCGGFQSAHGQSLSQTGLLVALGLVLVLRFVQGRRLSNVAGVGRTAWVNTEVACLLLAACYAAADLTGGLAGPFGPAVYLLVVVLVPAFSYLQSVGLWLLIVAIEAMWMILHPESTGFETPITRGLFAGLVGATAFGVLRLEVVAGREQVRKQIDLHVATIERDADDFRLRSATTIDETDVDPERSLEQRRAGSVFAIHDSIYDVLSIADRALKPHTVALFWLAQNGESWCLKEVCSRSDNVQTSAIGHREGVFGAIVCQQGGLRLEGLKPGYGGLAYYRAPQPVTDFLGVPVVEGGTTRGILVADRCNNQPFDVRESELLEAIGREILRAIQVEQIFGTMDQQTYHIGQFSRVLRDFNSALTAREVAEVATTAAKQIVRMDFAAVAVSTRAEGRMRVAALSWENKEGADKLVNSTFVANDGLVGAAIKARHPLPHGFARNGGQAIFGKGLDVPLTAVKVYPMLWKNIGVGALVLGSDRETLVSGQASNMVRIIADHAAIAVANAQMYEQMEELATTDGLTGLTNHRRFQEVYDLLFKRAERYERRLAVILCDIDHFKRINDTYGHPVGDKVIKRVAAVLRQSARCTDVVARYGGEEFAILMEEIDAAGAAVVAERIRLGVKAEEFRTGQGSFHCSMSLGVAVYPFHGVTRTSLMEAADEALYRAKGSGRDQTVTASVVGLEDGTSSIRLGSLRSES